MLYTDSKCICCTQEMGINIKNEGIRPNSDLYELNPDHTHFIIVDEEDQDRMFFTNIRCQLEQQFQYSVGRKRRLRRLFSWGKKRPSHPPTHTHTHTHTTHTLKFIFLPTTLNCGEISILL